MLDQTSEYRSFLEILSNEKIIFMIIRNASIHDAAAISGLLNNAADLYFTVDFSAQGIEVFKADFSTERISQRIEEGYKYYVAVVNGTLAGVCAIRGDSHLYNLFTETSFMRQGIARALWNHLLPEFYRREIQAVTVNASNYALPAYERLGFKRTGPTQEVNGVVFNPMLCHISNI